MSSGARRLNCRNLLKLVIPFHSRKTLQTLWVAPRGMVTTHKIYNGKSAAKTLKQMLWVRFNDYNAPVSQLRGLMDSLIPRESESDCRD
jgi:hypothetical protein